MGLALFCGFAFPRGVTDASLVDVRTFPRSRTNPAFNTDRLPDDLAREQNPYRHCSVLGGRRPRQRDIDDSLNGMWRVQSFHNYADYALADLSQLSE